MPQFMIEKKLKKDMTISLKKEDAYHISKVLRLKVNDWIEITDGKGNRYKSTIEKISSKEALIKIGATLPHITNTNITLAQALPKKGGIESIINKAVQLGVTTIVPFTSERTISKVSTENSKKKIQRWNKVAMEAAKQCGISFKPVVENITTLDELFKNGDKYTNRFFFYEGDQTNSVNKRFEKIKPTEKTMIVIGPEGGFSKDEVRNAKENNFESVSLGPLILRVETAAVSAITLTQLYLGHFD